MMANQTNKQEYYKFIQKTSEGEDKLYDPYFTHVAEYMRNIILFGNTIVLILSTLLKSKINQFPKTGMLGGILTGKEYKKYS